jgi:hypothetical protein
MCVGQRRVSLHADLLSRLLVLRGERQGPGCAEGGLSVYAHPPCQAAAEPHHRQKAANRCPLLPGAWTHGRRGGVARVRAGVQLRACWMQRPHHTAGRERASRAVLERSKGWHAPSGPFAGAATP